MNWLDIMRAEAERSSQKAVAAAIGMSRTAVSLVLAGKYPGGTTKVEKRVLATLSMVHCPHLDSDISRLRCTEFAHAQAPISGPSAARHWRACQACPLRPAEAPQPQGAKHAKR